MQLKIQRSQRPTGVMSKSVMFCVDARIHLTSEERDNIQKYRLGSQVLYSSDAAKRHAEGASGERFTSASSWARGIYHAAAARMALSITVDSLQRGQRIECKDLNEVLDAEEALKEACQSLRTYLLLAQTFDGGQLVWDYTEVEPKLVSAPVFSAPIPAVTYSPAASSAPGAEIAEPVMAMALPGATDAAAVPFNFRKAERSESPLDDAKEAVSNWWNGLTREQRKWLLIIGGIVLLVLLYEIF